MPAKGKKRKKGPVWTRPKKRQKTVQPQANANDGWEEYLSRIYFNPKHPASFRGAQKLHEAVLEEDKYKIGLAKIKTWLKDNESYSIHKDVNRRFPRLKVIVTGMHDQYDADLADMHKLARRNNGVTFLLFVIDVFSRFLWVEPLKNKSDHVVVAAFKRIFARGKKPRRLRTDKGGEFMGNVSQDYFDSVGLEQWSAHNDEIKANFAERVIRTLKSTIWSYMRKNKRYRYIDVLQDLVHSYNNTKHKSIGMKPSAVTKGDVERRLWWHLYKPTKPYVKSELDKPIRYLFKKGNHVRISHKAKTFQRGHDEKWSREIFLVRQPFTRQSIRKYRLEDLDGEDINGTFYEAELQKVKFSEDREFDIEKVVRKQGRESLVKWKGWPPKFNSWIPSNEVVIHDDGLDFVTSE